MAPVPHRPRVVTYYQTHHTPSGSPISVLPLISSGTTSLTHLILAALHLNADPSALTLNDHPPSHPRNATLWTELRTLQHAGIKVLAMLGGAAKGTYARLSGSPSEFESYYLPLRDLVRERRFDGLDLDVEEETPLSSIIRLIDRLRSDFGPSFIITLAPVASALLDPRANLSGFDYEALEVMRGKEIAFYNAQFYCGWGSAADARMYAAILSRGWPAEKVVVGLVTNPSNGAGFVELEALAPVLKGLVGWRFGGVMGWEYFNSLPGGRERPWEWAGLMGGLLGSTRRIEGADVVDEEGEAESVPRPFDYYLSDEEGGDE